MVPEETKAEDVEAVDAAETATEEGAQNETPTTDEARDEAPTDRTESE